MAANTAPIFTGQPQIDWGSTDGVGGATGPLKTQNTALDGTGTILVVFTADATNGGFARFIRCRPAGTNIATVIRFFINNGSVNSTAANNILFEELSLPATTANAAAGLTGLDVLLGVALPAGYRILATLGTTVSAGWYVSTVGGKYTL